MCVFLCFGLQNCPTIQTKPIQNLKVSTVGIATLLRELELFKAPGPDDFSNIVLKSCTDKIASSLSIDVPEIIGHREGGSWLVKGQHFSCFQERSPPWSWKLQAHFSYWCTMQDPGLIPSAIIWACAKKFVTKKEQFKLKINMRDQSNCQYFWVVLDTGCWNLCTGR